MERYLKYTPWFIGTLVVLSIWFLVHVITASGETVQQKAAADIPVQQKVLEENKAAYNAYLHAQTKLQADMNCVSDPSQCPLASGEPSAK